MNLADPIALFFSPRVGIGCELAAESLGNIMIVWDGNKVIIERFFREFKFTLCGRVRQCVIAKTNFYRPI